MQTYVPGPDVLAFARQLTQADLVESVVTAVDLVDEMHIDGEHTALAEHPLYKMWDGFGVALCAYALALCDEINSRDYTEAVTPVLIERSEAILHRQMEDATSGEYVIAYPSWVESPALHIVHRSLLLRNNPVHYRQFWPKTPMTIPEIWPVP